MSTAETQISLPQISAHREIVPNPTFSQLTTTRVGGPVTELCLAQTTAQLIEYVQSADAAQIPVMILAGGSNTLVSDQGFLGRTIVVDTKGLKSTSLGDTVRLEVAAGEVWDDVVAYCVTQGWSGIETLSGIPGLVGATPIQNVGAYGCEVSSVIKSVTVWDRDNCCQQTVAAKECQFGYRTSMFKRNPNRYVVLSVTMDLAIKNTSIELTYKDLLQKLNLPSGAEARLSEVRQAVLEIRAGKGMVWDIADNDTWSTGSFFTNPILDAQTAASLPEDAPRYPTDEGFIKTSAAWLISHSGFDKGFTLPGLEGKASLSTKHVLAITNRGQAKAADIFALKDAVIAGVQREFGITLVPEPNIWD